MKGSFEFRVEEWLRRDNVADAERASFGAVAILGNGIALTDLYDAHAKSVRSAAYASVLHLATWLAANWWRLRWEPKPARPDLAWRMAHELGAAGGGFAWPVLMLAADGENVSFSCRGTHSTTSDIRYLCDAEGTVAADVFEHAVDDLMSRLMARLKAFGTEAPELAAAWNEIVAERRDPEIANRRRRESLLGCDPGDMEDERLAQIVGDGIWMGESALDESLAAARATSISDVLERLKALSTAPGQEWDLSSLAGVRRVWRSEARRFDEPWQKGAALAQLARKELGIGEEEQMDSKRLGSLVNGDLFKEGVAKQPFATGFRDVDAPLRVRFHGIKPRPVSRRFEVARLIADSLLCPDGDVLLPLTEAGTARQKAQRSFAQEFLCPVEGLKRLLPLPDPSSSDIEAAAEHYDVSDFAVRTGLVNRGLIDRSYLPRK